MHNIYLVPGIFLVGLPGPSAVSTVRDSAQSFYNCTVHMYTGVLYSHIYIPYATLTPSNLSPNGSSVLKRGGCKKLVNQEPGISYNFFFFFFDLPIVVPYIGL